MTQSSARISSSGDRHRTLLLCLRILLFPHLALNQLFCLIFFSFSFRGSIYISRQRMKLFLSHKVFLTWFASFVVTSLFSKSSSHCLPQIWKCDLHSVNWSISYVSCYMSLNWGAMSNIISHLPIFQIQ